MLKVRVGTDADEHHFRIVFSFIYLSSSVFLCVSQREITEEFFCGSCELRLRHTVYFLFFAGTIWNIQ